MHRIGNCINFRENYIFSTYVTVNANWRLTFTFNGKDTEIVNYQDYH
ncbi:MAG: type II toxin-antitoxin system RelE/ParE family toxin [Cardiobacteriaceae bacterium]|nr:type II toxin-antitoxin system RelE/ParE family toxin [Cardiobacteriaceae bacterium]